MSDKEMAYSREIERLKEENNNLCLAINTLEEINRDLILRIESKKAHGWISVEEILPVPHHDVLVHYSNGKNEVGWSLPSLQHFTCECLHGKATHWMPLPPAPKGE